MAPSRVDLGEVAPDEVLTFTVQMALPDEAAFERAIADLYTPGSTSYRRWMTDAELRRFAPAPESVRQVTAELQRQGLRVSMADPQGFSLRVQGSVRAAAQAFQTSWHRVAVSGGTALRAASAPRLTGGMDYQIAAVTGLQPEKMYPMFQEAFDPHVLPGSVLGHSASSRRLQPAVLSPFDEAYTSYCFSAAAQTVTYDRAGKPAATGTFTGPQYGADPLRQCAFAPDDVSGLYRLYDAYQAGYHGEGQTVVITGAFGYPNVLNDVNTFSWWMEVAPLLDTAYREVYPQGKPADPNAATKSGWDKAIAQQVEWVHAVAPAASIVLVVAKDDTDVSLQAAEDYVITHHLGHIVSNPWGGAKADGRYLPEQIVPYTRLFQRGAAQGINFDFASGDAGNFDNPVILGSTQVPADSPYVTAIGGTSAFLSRTASGFVGGTEYGWGNYQTTLATNGSLADPPVPNRFQGGSGGGQSAQYAKPSWQATLPGDGRHVPDVAALADPHTGCLYLVTQGRSVIFGVAGGTGLATAIWSGYLALADQLAGHPLGHLAPRLAPSNPSIKEFISDVVPPYQPTNVTGSITEAGQAPVFYGARDFFKTTPQVPDVFQSFLWPIGPESGRVVTFGTDSYLTVTPGWDNVTGWGAPAGLSLLQALAGQ
ncbi:MAG: hypothetical protein INR62_01715 [Rhodospirillales bacterium]|nr:hypothetical protein [Acetobacter sp.]